MMESSFEDRSVPITVLRPKTKALICDLLNPQMFISAPNGILRYWRGLAGLCKISANYEASLVEDLNPTSRVLNLWYETDPDNCSIQNLLLFLEEMDRFDVIADIIDLIDQDIKSYRENPQPFAVKPISLAADRHILTTDDVERINKGLPLENYHAFLFYDQDDIDFAIQLLEIMEKEYNMKFCVKDRDLVGGGLELDKMITLITERCNRLVVILSDSFFRSSTNDYFLKFSEAYGIESERKIIPCVYKDLVKYPPHMKYLFTLDYRRMKIFNFWEKLRDSIVVGDDKVKINRSKSDNGHTLRSALHENQHSFRLRPLNQGVKFSASVGDLNNLEVISEPPINPSTSADNLGPEGKKEKKINWFKKIRSFRKKDKLFKKHMKTATAVAN